MFWPFRRKKVAEVVTNATSPDDIDRESWFASDRMPFDPEKQREALRETLDGILAKMPKFQPPELADGETFDSCDENGLTQAALMSSDAGGGVSEALYLWYATQGFIGHQMCAVLSQNWMINKVCLMPGRDAVRQGYDIKAEDGETISPHAMRIFKRYDKRFGLNKNMVEFIRLGRIFGIRIAFAKIKSDDPLFYEKPFNPDGIKPRAYRGLVQVDPYWCAPILDERDTSDPSAIHFYEPTYWLINGKKYHRSHLIIFKTCEMPDILKPSYYYGGVPVPQAIMERVYAAERTANEGPNIALSKRTTVLKTDAAKALSNEGIFAQKMRVWMSFWSNFGVKVIDKEDDDVEQFDTALADFDALIMTQYQLVAAASEVPATKILGTTPKGMNATGEYDESSYHEMLESLQTHDLTPLAERHHLCVMRSYVVPAMRLREPDFKAFGTFVDWAPLDSPTMKEYAEIEEINSRTAVNYANTGAFDQYDIRSAVVKEEHSMFHGLPDAEPPETESDPNDPETDYRVDLQTPEEREAAQGRDVGNLPTK